MAITEDILRTKFGFNDPGVMKGILSNPGEVARYEREYAQMGGGGGTGSSGSVGNFNDYVSQAQNMYKAAAKPAIESLQASVPEIKSTVAGKTQMLNERYKNLIDEIKGGQQKAENRQTVVTAGELGKRGIDPTSTLYGQELTSAVNPITSEYTGMLKSAATDQTAGQMDLANLETEQLANVRQTIANLQMGTDTNAINTAMQLYTQAQTNAANAASVAEAKRQNDIANALKQSIYENVTLPESKASTAYTQAQTTNLGKTSTGTASSKAASQLQSDVNSGVPFYELYPRYKDALPEYQIRAAYNAGPLAKVQGPAKESSASLGKTSTVNLDSGAIDGYTKMILEDTTSISSVPTEYRNAVISRFNQLYGK